MQRLKEWYHAHEGRVSSIALIGGFILDSLTLRRVDLWAENIYIIILLCVTAFCIGAITVLEKRRLLEEVPGRAHFWFVVIIQFALGGLFSTFFVFYSRSSTFSASWPFLVMLAGAMIGNEVFKKHYLRLSFLISVFFVAIYSFAIFAVPLVFRQIGPLMFVASTVVSIFLLFVFLVLLRFFTGERYEKSKRILQFSIGGIILLLNILYFTNLIPPIPLGLKDVQAYHMVQKIAPGEYRADGEAASVWDFFRRYQPFHTAGGPVYIYSAIFSPANLDTTIVHHWQYYDEKEKKWQEYGRIKLSIVGGRDGGFRTYSVVFNPRPGKWRVDVETERGQGIGRIKFEIIKTATQPALVSEVK